MASPRRVGPHVVGSRVVPGRLYAGTSGYAFGEWKGHFYPEKLGQKAMLPYYAERLGTVEINYTFRHHPSSETLATWLASTPDSFRFSVKAHQTITHMRRLKDLESAHIFIDRAAELGDRLGPLLFQCPPNMKADRALIRDFVGGLPKGLRYAFEFRHPSWGEASDVLLRAGAAVVLSDTDEEPLGDIDLEQGRFVYLRLRKTRYSKNEILGWAARIQSAIDAGTEVYCYFKHEDAGRGPKLAAQLLKAASIRRSGMNHIKATKT